jgi:FeS assembly SUF system regulator
MLRISKLADYGVIVMVYLAKNPEHLCSTREIAMHTHLALPTVSKVLKRLTAANLLCSIRGVKGGYQLQRAPASISVASILDALDDRERGFTECSLEPNVCVLQDVCHMQGHWQMISQTIESALSSISLASLVKPLPAMKTAHVLSL